MPWVPRGLRNGTVTTGWPKRPDPYFDEFPATIVVRADAPALTIEEAEHVVRDSLDGSVGYGPADAAGTVRLFVDRGACVLSGRMVRAYPHLFAWHPGSALVAADRRSLIVSQDQDPGADTVRALREKLGDAVRHLGQSVHIRHVDAGSDGSDEWEVQALVNPVYDVHRLGIFFTASPRHADILLVTGIGTAGMVEPLRRTREAMPDPVVVIATGADAISGGLIGRGGHTSGHGVSEILDVDVWVPGAPASPFTLLHAILAAIGRLPAPSHTRHTVRGAS